MTRTKSFRGEHANTRPPSPHWIWNNGPGILDFRLQVHYDAWRDCTSFIEWLMPMARCQGMKPACSIILLQDLPQSKRTHMRGQTVFGRNTVNVCVDTSPNQTKRRLYFECAQRLNVVFSHNSVVLSL